MQGVLLDTIDEMADFMDASNAKPSVIGAKAAAGKVVKDHGMRSKSAIPAAFLDKV